MDRVFCPYGVDSYTTPVFRLSDIRTRCADGLEVCLWQKKEPHPIGMTFIYERTECPHGYLVPVFIPAAKFYHKCPVNSPSRRYYSMSSIVYAISVPNYCITEKILLSRAQENRNLQIISTLQKVQKSQEIVLAVPVLLVVSLFPLPLLGPGLLLGLGPLAWGRLWLG